MLDELKLLLGISMEDITQDEKLSWILNSTLNRLKQRLDGLDVPEELNYIVVEVSVIRFNRIGSEGLSSHSVEGESLSFMDDDFDRYKNDIQAYLDRQDSSNKGKVRFI